MPNIHSSISFGLVNIPIQMNNIITNNDIAFNQLHKKCSHRIEYIKYCPKCKKDLKETDIIKGYQYEKNKYLTFTKEELNKLKLPNEKEIEVIGFVDIKEIDPIYYEKSFFLTTLNSSKSYKLFYEALKERGYNPISQLVGYLISGDPGYITSYKGARSKICEYDRAKLLEIILSEFIEKNI